MPHQKDGGRILSTNHHTPDHPITLSPSRPPSLQGISFESEEDPGYLGDMPFMAMEKSNNRGNRIRMTADEALEVLFGLRGELEVRGGTTLMMMALSVSNPFLVFIYACLYPPRQTCPPCPLQLLH